jgi:CubicO group peptidase (beta-lactamase class C family)
MKNIRIDILSVLFLVFLTSCFSAGSTDSSVENQTIYSQTKPESNKSEIICQALTEIVNDGKAPGMIAAIISNEGVIAIASAGERKAGSGIAFTTNDVVHLGSCGKAMTATMLATLVAEGKLNWETNLIDIFPELKGMIHSDYYNITLWQLLHHRAGLPKNAMDWDEHKQKEIKERRLTFLKENLQKAASYKYGEFHYSNFGYMIAACMAEKITGLSWEVLMKKRLFDPLGMSSAGFGAPNTHNQIDQPWGHSWGHPWGLSLFGSKWKPDQSDYPEALAPAGLLHCSIEDWAKFISLQLGKENPILERKYLNKLIEPEGDYAAGWFILEQPWVKGIVLVHGGTNEIWHTLVVVAPTIDRAFVVATNSCDLGVTPELCNDMIKELISLELNISIKGN